MIILLLLNINTPALPLLLQLFMDDGDHLASGEPLAPYRIKKYSFVYFFHIIITVLNSYE